MAEQQKIHPVDLEASTPALAGASTKPTAPLVPSNAVRSDYPPSQRRTIPLSHARPPKRKRSCCCRCICWTIFLLILLIVAIAATAGILYLIFRPKLPSYSVDRLNVTAFSVDAALTAHASFGLTITADNPNKHIGIYYLDDSNLSVWYEGTSLCSGTFPVFYQGHRNKTTVTAALNGEAQLGSAVSSALQQQQQTGSVPLRFKGDVPVKVKLGALKLWKVKARVRCDIVVNSLTAGNLISIKTSNCKFSIKL